MELVTGFAGKAHITSAQTGTFNAGVVGGGSYVMPTGEKLTATIITNNLIRVLDGDIVMNGRHITIPKGTYEEVEIANGLQGMKRNDLIVARYEKDANTGIETASLVVIQGTSTDETASDPEYNDNDISEGTLISDMPLYRITLDGLTVGEPEPLFTVAKSMEELKDCIDELNNKLIWKTHLDTTPTKGVSYTLPNEWNELHIYLGRNSGHSYTWQVVGNYNNFESIYLPQVGATNSETVILIKNNTILVSALTEGGTDILGNASNFGLRLIIKYR